MPRIPPVQLPTASERVRPLLEGLKRKLGMVPNLFATIGQSPEALQALLGAMEASAREPSPAARSSR